MYQPIMTTFIMVGLSIEVILFLISQYRLGKHLRAPHNRHWDRDYEILKQDNKDCATNMLLTIAIALISILIIK